jgi:hypothetical protein
MEEGRKAEKERRKQVGVGGEETERERGWTR